jgi:hypothetical protein
MKRLAIIFIIFISCTPEESNSDVVQQSSLKIGFEEVVKIQNPIRVKALTNTISEEDTVDVTIANRHYILYPDGKIAVKFASGESDTFHLKTEDQFLIEQAYFLDYKDKLVIWYTSTDYESGASYIECFDKNTNKFYWKNDIHAFNLTDPIVVDNMTYVASIGFVGKLNLDNGQYIWMHDGLYEKTKFNSFIEIELVGKEVHFIESTYSDENKKPGRVIVDDITGKIEKIIKTRHNKK